MTSADVLCIVFLIVLLLCLIVFTINMYHVNKHKVIELLRKLIVAAEEEFGGGTGPYKLEVVITRAYKALPDVYQKILPKSLLIKWIELTLAELKDEWEDYIE